MSLNTCVKRLEKTKHYEKQNFKTKIISKKILKFMKKYIKFLYFDE